MNKVDITFDEETGYYSAIILSRGITTQAKNLDELVKNLGETVSLSKEKHFSLNKFNLSFEDKYVNF